MRCLSVFLEVLSNRKPILVVHVDKDTGEAVLFRLRADNKGVTLEKVLVLPDDDAELQGYAVPFIEIRSGSLGLKTAARPVDQPKAPARNLNSPLGGLPPFSTTLFKCRYARQKLIVHH